MTKRSKWKVTLEVDKLKNNKRSAIIGPKLLYNEIYAYNGKAVKAFKVELDHLGKRLGSLVETKYSPMFKVKKKWSKK